jgi:uncharacterized membrane protein
MGLSRGAKYLKASKKREIVLQLNLIFITLTIKQHMPDNQTIQTFQGPKTGRLEALDLFKFFILFFMIQGHLFRAYLLESIRHAEWYRIHEIFHGAAAPAFLFAAGFAAFLSYRNKQDQYVKPGKALVRRLLRVLFILWCSIWMRLPFFSLQKTLAHLREKGIASIIQSEILMCIGVSLLLFIGLAVLLKKEKFVVVASGVVGLAFFLLPQVVYDLRVASFIDPFLDHRLSPFPLFPWAGFLFLGVICGYVYIYVSGLKDKKVFFRLLAISGAVMLPWYFWYHTPGYHRTEWTLPGNLNKIAVVFLLFYLAYLLTSHFRAGVVNFLEKAGKETLFVYILHLHVLYNTAFHGGLYGNLSKRLDVPEALALLLIVLLAVFLPALLYGWLKEKHPRWWRFVFYGYWLGFAVIFIYRPY